MDKKKLNEMLDTVYELEGLIYLALNREDSLGNLKRLIKLKSKALSDICDNISPDSVTDQTQEMLSDNYFYSSEETNDIPPRPSKQPVQKSVINNDDSESRPEGEERRESKAKNLDENVNKDEPSNRPRGRLVFSVNDKFRFRRELFENSDASFNTTLALVASMDSYEEAEEYFVEELQMDPGNQTVAEFLEIIRKYFNS